MTKFKPGDRVKTFYVCSATRKPCEYVGVVDEISSDGNVWVKLNHCTGLYHPKQLRRLVKKSVKLKHRHAYLRDGVTKWPCFVHGCDWTKVKAAHKHETYGGSYGSGRIPCPVDSCSYGREPAPPVDRVQYKFGPMTGTGIFAAVPDNATGRKSEDSRGSDLLCLCGHKKKDHIYEESACRPGFICEKRCERFDPITPKPAPREWWIKLDRSDGFRYWETEISNDPDESEMVLWTHVREVLPDDKGEL